MSSELSTFLIEDPRISRITSDIHVAVKDGPASCVIQGYPTNSNSASTTLFNVNVPSENTLVDRNIRVSRHYSVRDEIDRWCDGNPCSKSANCSVGISTQPSTTIGISYPQQRQGDRPIG